MESRRRPELWAGIECTRNRVGDRFFDQLDRSGHAARLSDLDLLAALGATTVRYPILWERVAPDGLGSADWSWADERLERLGELGLRPVVGFVHHGSGPPSTSLVDASFPSRLAEFAAAVAERYPWIDAYTPVNEPLTTARFSGLYGLWYPHGRDHPTFLRTLLTECRGIVESVRAIREVRPDAALIQTEDLGKCFGTPLLQYQVRHENERRWLSFDLLCGRVDEMHPLWSYLIGGCEVDPDDLAWFREHPCPPDVLGINHYLSSERFLDERLERYPPEAHGGNGRHEYADVLAARVLPDGPAGPRVLLRETWDRFGLPVAVTEAHNGCTREEQLRWLLEVWDAAVGLADEGVDVRAVTAWSVLGAHGWATLCTSDDDAYEPGLFDLRAPSPRPTALAAAAGSLARTGSYDHPVLDVEGWWRRDDRLWYGFGPGESVPPQGDRRRAPRPIVIAGARGTLGRAFARLCESRGLAHRLLSRQDMELTDPDSVRSALKEIRPWAVVNATGYVRVDDAESDAEACRRSNVVGASILAEACSARDMPLVAFSSDLVFDGSLGRPYVESDPVAPLSVYGRTKAEAEQAVLGRHSGALVVRTSAFFGPWDVHNFVTIALRRLAAGERVVAPDDAVVSPTYVPDLVHAALDLLVDGERGIWHLANEGSVTWCELARMAAAVAGLDAGLVEGRPLDSFGWPAPRPRWSVLGSERGWVMPPLHDALSRYVEERKADAGPFMPSVADAVAAVRSTSAST